MGCFLGCFGGAKKDCRRVRKRRDKVHGTAGDDHLKSRVSLVREFPQKLIAPSAEISHHNKPEEKSNSITRLEEKSDSPARKRVTFDTNVRTYEHVLLDGSVDFSQDKRDESTAYQKEALVNPSRSQCSSSENSSITSSSGYNPPNHRYQNCGGSDDEEEDELDEESELDYDDEYGLLDEEDEDDGYYAGVDHRINRIKEVYSEEVADNSSEIMDDLVDETVEVKPRASNSSARDRSAYVHPVLNPVENLTQWKAVKAKGRTPQLKRQKENLDSDQGETCAPFSLEPKFEEPSFHFKAKSECEARNSKKQEIAVDASLSTWLSQSETTHASDSCSVGLDATTPGKSVSYGSNSARSREDRPILGALTVEEIKQFSASSSPRKSPSRSPNETPIIGTVGGYWNHTMATEDSSSASSFKGIPNTTSKYREDKRVNWHATPFEKRLERALDRGVGGGDAYTTRSGSVH